MRSYKIIPGFNRAYHRSSVSSDSSLCGLYVEVQVLILFLLLFFTLEAFSV
jgi:hypothetical protein